MADVVRTDTGHIRVGHVWFNLSDVSGAAYNAVSEAESDNPAFDMPPFCYTGCPYGEAILALGCPQVSPPEAYRIESAPQDGVRVWRSREPIWPEVFGIDRNLHEWAGNG